MNKENREEHETETDLEEARARDLEANASSCESCVWKEDCEKAFKTNIRRCPDYSTVEQLKVWRVRWRANTGGWSLVKARSEAEAKALAREGKDYDFEEWENADLDFVVDEVDFVENADECEDFQAKPELRCEFIPCRLGEEKRCVACVQPNCVARKEIDEQTEKDEKTEAKAEWLKRLKDLRAAAFALDEAWGREIESEQEGYPFSKSFDELTLEIDDWFKKQGGLP